MANVLKTGAALAAVAVLLGGCKIDLVETNLCDNLPSAKLPEGAFTTQGVSVDIRNRSDGVYDVRLNGGAKHAVTACRMNGKAVAALPAALLGAFHTARAPEFPLPKVGPDIKNAYGLFAVAVSSNGFSLNGLIPGGNAGQGVQQTTTRNYHFSLVSVPETIKAAYLAKQFQGGHRLDLNAKPGTAMTLPPDPPGSAQEGTVDKQMEDFRRALQRGQGVGEFAERGRKIGEDSMFEAYPNPTHAPKDIVLAESFQRAFDTMWRKSRTEKVEYGANIIYEPGKGVYSVGAAQRGAPGFVEIPRVERMIGQFHTHTENYSRSFSVADMRNLSRKKWLFDILMDPEGVQYLMLNTKKTVLLRDDEKVFYMLWFTHQYRSSDHEETRLAFEKIGRIIAHNQGMAFYKGRNGKLTKLDFDDSLGNIDILGPSRSTGDGRNVVTTANVEPYLTEGTRRILRIALVRLGANSVNAMADGPLTSEERSTALSLGRQFLARFLARSDANAARLTQQLDKPFVTNVLFLVLMNAAGMQDAENFTHFSGSSDGVDYLVNAFSGEIYRCKDKFPCANIVRVNHASFKP